MEQLAALGAGHRPLSLALLRSNAQVGEHLNSKGFLCPLKKQSRESLELWNGGKVPNLCGGSRAKLLHFTASAATDETPVQDPGLALSMVTVKFVLERECHFGQRFNVIGEDPLLGAWDPSLAVPLEWSEGNIWNCEIVLPAGKPYEYKFICTSKEGEPEWQPGPNRILDTRDSSSPLVVSGTWEVEEAAEDSVQATSSKSKEEEPAVVEAATKEATDSTDFEDAAKEATGSTAGTAVEDAKEQIITTSEDNVDAVAAPAVGANGFITFKFGDEKPSEQPVSAPTKADNLHSKAEHGHSAVELSEPQAVDDAPEVPFLDVALATAAVRGLEETEKGPEN